MNKKRRVHIIVSASFLVAFILWTLLLITVDIQSVGPAGTTVGFGTINEAIHNATGVHLSLYYLTDWLSIIPVMIIFMFAIIGSMQLLKRKSIRRVDHNILALGVFYVAVLSVYLLFELVVINYRPVLIDGVLEASYPSSTTVLVMCVMCTLELQLKTYIHDSGFRRLLHISISIFSALMVILRFCSGVHWFSDIIGGILLSTGLVELYHSVILKHE